MAERIPLPNDRAREKRPIHIEYLSQSMPRQRFAVRLDWNSYMESWTIEIEHVDIERRVTKSTATPYRVYSYLPNAVWFFADPSGEQKRVTPSNLGDEMKLFSLPGPSGRDPQEDD